MSTKANRVKTMDHGRETRNLAARVRDILLSAVTLGSKEEREWDERVHKMIGMKQGMIWDGTWRAQLDKLDHPAAISAVVDRMGVLGKSSHRDAGREIGTLADYLTDRNLGSSNAVPGPSGSLVFNGSLEADVSDREKIEAMNRTNDAFWAKSTGRTRDAILHAEPAAFNPNLFGTRWTGDLAPVGAAVKGVMDALGKVKDRAQVRGALAKAVMDIANYGNEIGSGLGTGSMGPGPFDSLSTGRLEEVFDIGAGAEPTNINDANKAFWDKANRSVTGDHRYVRPRAPQSIEEINAINTAFWAKPPTFRLGGKWGGG